MIFSLINVVLTQLKKSNLNYSNIRNHLKISKHKIYLIYNQNEKLHTQKNTEGFRKMK